MLVSEQRTWSQQGTHPKSETVAISVVNGFDQGHIVHGLDVVVGAVVDLDL